MKAIKVGYHDFLLQVPSCPFDLLDSYYSDVFLEDGIHRLELILESSISKKPSREIRKDPSYLCYEIKRLQGLIVAFYLLHEQRDKFSRLTGRFTPQFLKGLSKDIYGAEHRFSPSCLALTEEELLAPFSFLKKVTRAISIPEWLDFLEQCAQNSLAFGYEPYWEGVEKQTACTYYLTKLHNLGFLIVAAEERAKVNPGNVPSS